MELLNKTINRIEPLDKKSMEAVKKREYDLTKPIGSLGRLEDLAIKIAGIQGSSNPLVKNKVITLFAGDHHVVYEENIASAPIEVTAQQLNNFATGGGAINVFSNFCGAKLVVVDVGVATKYNESDKIINKNIALGAKNIAKGPAMTWDEAVKSIETGIEIVENEVKNGMDILGIGEMGIGNTTPSSAIYSLYTGVEPKDITGPGAGIKKDVILKKIKVIENALKLNKPDKNNAIDVLSKIGGFEIGAMTGAILGAAANRIPVVVDGFISTAAAFLARTLNPLIDDYIILSHKSAETGYSYAAGFLGQKPLLDLDMRLGEGTGAALGINLVEIAIKTLNEMATFSSAGVVDVKEI